MYVCVLVNCIYVIVIQVDIGEKWSATVTDVRNLLHNILRIFMHTIHWVTLSIYHTYLYGHVVIEDRFTDTKVIINKH